MSGARGQKMVNHINLQSKFITGPFPSDDNNVNILIARPIPRGYTVIARPIIGAPPAPLILKHDQITKINPPVPKTTNSEETISNTEYKDKSLTHPMVMMWSAEFPEGRLVPLRQPAPPVYFQPQN